MPVHLVVFEDAGAERFLPLSHTRPMGELFCGTMPFRERTERTVGQPAVLTMRPHLAAVWRAQLGRTVNPRRLPPGECLWVNARAGALKLPGRLRSAPASLWDQDQLVACVLDTRGSRQLLESAADNDYLVDPAMLPPTRRFEAREALVTYPWELIHQNGEWLARDVAELFPPLPKLVALRGVDVLGNAVTTAGNAQIDPGVCLDSRNGPIILGSEAVLRPHTRVEGPAAIGHATQLVGGKIRGGTTLGPHCRVGGEVEESIFLGYTNKYHEGFIGHAYLGEWVNLGALTTNSDLKNNYGSVKMWNAGQLVDTGSAKVGAVIGDHTKTGIGTLLNTGAVVGVAANVFGGGLVRAPWVPSFSWGLPPECKTYRLPDCLATMQVVMERRGRAVTAAYRRMVEYLHRTTERERLDIA